MNNYTHGSKSVTVIVNMVNDVHRATPMLRPGIMTTTVTPTLHSVW